MGIHTHSSDRNRAHCVLSFGLVEARKIQMDEQIDLVPIETQDVTSVGKKIKE